MTTVPAAEVSYHQYCPAHVVTAQNHMPQADLPALVTIPCVPDVTIQATGGHTVRAVVAHKPFKKPEGTKKRQGGHHHNCQQCGHRWTDVVDVGEDYNPQLNEVNVARVTLQHDHEWPATHPEYITIADVDINTMTEAFTTMKMSADIGPNQLRKVCCKVDPGIGGNVMLLCVFQKLFPSQ